MGSKTVKWLTDWKTFRLSAYAKFSMLKKIMEVSVSPVGISLPQAAHGQVEISSM